jgi:phosphoenolpyruvate phosphomutase
MRKTTRFKQLLHSPELEFLLEAHNGISARIGEEAGFRGLWASGLCLSAQFGVRDSNEASWTQVLEMLEFMADATSVPILLDGDTGYGNFNNMRRLVRKLEQRGIAAVCIEDKLFPKTNSFLRGETQPLADPEEFCGKIRAGKEAQRDPDFCVVARVEALIAGWGLGEALRRAEAYVEAGADAILIHSARSTADEVLAFQREWDGRAPVVIVPTKYYATPTDVFRDAGFSIAIWANHMMRASIAAMQATAAEVASSQNLLRVEDRVVPVAEVFRLQGADELKQAEKRYLPRTAARTRAVVLAASRGAELGELTEERPKALVRVRGKPLLEHIVDAYNGVGVKDITVVRGYRKEAFDLVGLRYVDNDEYADTGELWSLKLALDEARGADQTLVVSYGDVLFNRFLVQALTETEGDLAVVVDSQWREGSNHERWADYVACTEPDSRRAFYRTIGLRRVDHAVPEAERHGEWTGFLKVAPSALPRVRELVDELLADPARRKAMVSDLLNALVDQGEQVQVVYVAGHWLDVDSLADIERAGSFA